MSKCYHKNGHRADNIMFRSKPDSVYVECNCGETECIGVWFSKAPLNWDPEGWDNLLKSINAFLDYRSIDIYK